MTTKPLTQKRRGFGEWWDGLAEGWQQLRQHATQAITRFNPLAHDSNSDSGEQRLAGNASRWGLVAAELREVEEDHRRGRKMLQRSDRRGQQPRHDRRVGVPLSDVHG